MLGGFTPLVQDRSRSSLDQRASVTLRAVWADRRGVTSVEYALLGSFLAMAIFAGGSMVSSAVQDSFSNVSAGRNTCHQTCEEGIRRDTCKDEQNRL